ncbi:hypothetical protein [Jannaschia pohangensis]|uniref:Uncharacterized protein n=1 Tax=Jannaschia pohangensis TaxID=390807 RepID=A0A1I3R7K7_9RHOB|nr:hypothetical protein [Jannaschia pohangensis]SFJ42020.1 hypothetical protein SAMN04488095_2811 [Jannaschia pohangensis]
MLNLRRLRPAAASEPQLTKAKAAPDPVPSASNAEKARALIALLEAREQGAAGTQAPPEHLRDWARDLIRTVEARRADPKTEPAQAPTKAPVRLFSTAAPRLTDPVAPPPQAKPISEPAHDVPRELAAAVAQPPTPSGRTATMASPTLAPAEVRKLIDGAFDPAMMAREHPAIIAMTLVGKPSMEQAAALRSLPSGQVRAVHKALRQMQMGA